MNLFKRISIFLILILVLCSVLTINIFATDADTQEIAEQTTEQVTESSKLDMNMSGADMTLGERASYALQGIVTGMLMVFAVLALLAAIVSLSKVIFYDIPNKKKAKAEALKAAELESTEKANVPEIQPVVENTNEENNTELIAVITAAVAAMLETEEYANQFESGFRVVSFNRVNTSGAWNKK